LAFERRIKSTREVQLVSCMDMIFNLLLFFLVTSYLATNAKVEKRFIFPTPKTDLGSAEIFIQWVDDRSVFWIDQGASVEIQRILDQNSYLAPQDQSRAAIDLLKERNLLDLDRLRRNLHVLVHAADSDPGKKYFVLFRCPNEIPYFEVMDAVAELSDAKFGNIEYGTLGGTIGDLQLGVIENTDANGNLRRLIRIDFKREGA
jgi:biopolymer transport protein ExbD